MLQWSRRPWRQPPLKPRQKLNWYNDVRGFEFNNYYPYPDSIRDGVLFSKSIENNTPLLNSKPRTSLFIYLFVCFFVSKITRKRLNRFAWNFQGRCGVTMRRPDSILGQFREIARCRDANFSVSICRHYQQSAHLAVVCGHLTTENVMNFATSQHGDGVCCYFAPQLVFNEIN